MLSNLKYLNTSCVGITWWGTQNALWVFLFKIYFDIYLTCPCCWKFKTDSKLQLQGKKNNHGPAVFQLVCEIPSDLTNWFKKKKKSPLIQWKLLKICCNAFFFFFLWMLEQNALALFLLNLRMKENVKIWLKVPSAHVCIKN